jgi:drug/metabolite transporter (DMT)-like permease
MAITNGPYRGDLQMDYGIAILMLVGAALLEVGGDALMRAGIHSGITVRRVAFMLAAGLVLAVYGYTVNAPRWNFGRLLGVYVAIFYVVAQAIAWLGFGEKPTTRLLVAGALMIAGGLVASLG